jgi:threonine dehydratase
MAARAHELELRHVLAARRRLAGRIRRTPIEPSPSLSARTGGRVFLKLESEQLTGAFKIRGATSALRALDAAARARGVAAASTGNHGRALASAARDAGVRAIICLSELVPEVKVEAIRDLGAEVRVVGRSHDDAQLEVERLVAEAGMTEIPPFDHPEVIAGQGTLGLEIVEDEPEVDTVLVPMSGGGLIAGVGLAIKSMLPEVKVIGV